MMQNERIETEGRIQPNSLFRYRKQKVKTVNDILVKDRRQLYMSLQTGSPGLD